MIFNAQKRLRIVLASAVKRHMNSAQARVSRLLDRYVSVARRSAQRAAGLFPFSHAARVPRVPPITAVVLACGGITAAGGYLIINDYETVRFRGELDRAASEIASILTKSIDRHIAIAEAAGARFSGPRANVSRWAFFEYAKTLPGENPGLGAIAWLPRVIASRRGAFEESARSDGLFDFRFVEVTSQDLRRRASERTEYFPIFFVEPYRGNETMLGVDFAADPNVAAFLNRVRDSGKTAALPAELNSVADTAEPGFSVLVPVFRSRIPPFTVAERHDSLSGFIRASFRFDQFLQSIRTRAGHLPALDIFIFDLGAGTQRSLIHIFTSQTGDRQAEAIDASAALQGAYAEVMHDVAGRQWSIVIKPARHAYRGILGVAAWGFVVFTLLLTVLLLRHLTTLRTARENAEAANRAKSEFLAMMSHELRTPLNAVIGFSDMMVQEIFGPLRNDHYKQYTTHINRSAAHLLDLINTILDLSKVDSGYYEIAREDVALDDIWTSILPILQQSIAESGVRLNEGLTGSSLILHADPRVFRQVLLNLVSNAIKFSPGGGSIFVSAGTATDDGFTLTVADTGIGIARQDLDLVQTPFRQVDNSLARKYEGIGLGLPLTRKLVELHGGRLKIDSTLGKGTTVLVTFPGDIVVSRGATCAENERPAENAAVSASASNNDENNFNISTA